MAEISEKVFAVYMEGHEGHRGNVLAHAWISKVNTLLSVLARLERQYLDVGKRKTVFEVVDTQKRNPTIINLKPVPAAHSYDPMPAFKWSLDQLERVASEKPVDQRIDAETADMMASLSRQPSEDAYRRFWINGFFAPVEFNEEFGVRARKIAAQRRAASVEPDWFVGTAFGSVTGHLEAIDDENGARSFVVIPPVGAPRIACLFPTEKKDEMGGYVFKNVRVTGLLTYSAKSPFPVKVKMETIETILPAKSHLLDLDGLFSGYDKPQPDYSALTK